MNRLQLLILGPVGVGKTTFSRPNIYSIGGCNLMNTLEGLQPLSAPESLQNAQHSDVVSLWKLEPQKINHAEAECLVYLSADERERAARFNQIADRQRFTYIRYALRHLLGEALACRPDEIIFQYSPTGRPEIALPNVPLRFNISHSQSITLIAITEHSPIGIDVEWIDREIETIAVGQNVFCEEEMCFLKASSGDERIRLFYKLWTAKEAVLKMLGTGFSLEPRSFCLLEALQENAIVQLPILTDGLPKWIQLVELDAGENYCAALAVGTDIEIPVSNTSDST